MERSRALQLKLAVAFSAIVVGFAGVVGYVPYALWRFTLRAEQIQLAYAEGARQLARIRGCGREIRQAALLAFYAGTESDRGRHVAAVASARERCAALVAGYDATISTARADPAAEEWRHFRTHDIPAHEAAADAVLAEARSPSPDSSSVSRLVESAADGDTMLERMVDLHARTAKVEATRIHEGLARLSLGYVVLGAVGALGATVLLLESLALVRRFARSADRREAELDAFAGQVAHDLRGPLQTIQLAVAVIGKSSPDARVQRLAGGATSGVQRLDRMIRELLELARAGGPPAPDEAADVAAVVLQSCDELQPRARRLGATLSLDVDPSARARASPVALGAIVTNLVDNALKYGSGDRPNEVTVSVTSARRGVAIAVRDRGVGIPPALLPHVFEPLVRGTDRSDSYGLGLATVKRLVEMHHGTVSVRSTEGQGTSFEVWLPGAPAAKPPARRDGARRSPAAPGVGGGDPPGAPA